MLSKTAFGLSQGRPAHHHHQIKQPMLKIRLMVRLQTELTNGSGATWFGFVLPKQNGY
jgi:hypothetical protein